MGERQDVQRRIGPFDLIQSVKDEEPQNSFGDLERSKGSAARRFARERHRARSVEYVNGIEALDQKPESL
jgi:hypothetical protein